MGAKSHESTRGKYDKEGNRYTLNGGGGGGGGGDGGAAERERQRQARIDAATVAINNIFGKGDAYAMQPTGERRLVGYDRSTVIPATLTDGNARDNLGVNRQPTSTVLRITPEQYAKEISARRPSGTSYTPIYDDVLANQITESGRAAQAREALYGQVRDDTNDYYTQQLAENSDEAARQLRFQQARQGTMGSSQQIDKGAEFQKRYDRGLLDIANKADAAATGMRSNDEQTRMSLLSKIAAGMDQASAMSSAHAQLASNADMARQNAMSGQMANVFSDLFAVNNAAAAAEGQRKAQKDFEDKFGSFFSQNGTYQGNVQKGP